MGKIKVKRRGEEKASNVDVIEEVSKEKVGSMPLVSALSLVNVNRPKKSINKVKRNSSLGLDKGSCCIEGLPSVHFDVDLVVLKKATIAEGKKRLVNDMFGGSQ